MPENVDHAELKKFSKLAATWWDETGEMQALHALNPLRMQFIEKHINLKNKYTLDVGCGGGILTESLAIAGAHTTGIDMSAELIQTAKLHLHLSQLKIKYYHTDINAFSAAHPQHFDVVTCMEMLEHVPSFEQVVTQLVNLIKPGGYLFLSTLNRNLLAYLGAIIAAEYIFNLLPKGTHEYARFIKPSELDHILRKNNCELIDMTGIGYNPLRKSYYLTDSVKINYLICYKKV